MKHLQLYESYLSTVAETKERIKQEQKQLKKWYSEYQELLREYFYAHAQGSHQLDWPQITMWNKGSRKPGLAERFGYNIFGKVIDDYEIGLDEMAIVLDAMQTQDPAWFEGQEMGFFIKEAVQDEDEDEELKREWIKELNAQHNRLSESIIHYIEIVGQPNEYQEYDLYVEIPIAETFYFASPNGDPISSLHVSTGALMMVIGNDEYLLYLDPYDESDGDTLQDNIAVMKRILNYLETKYPGALEGSEMGFFVKESWRQARTWLFGVPRFLLERLLHKLVKMVPGLQFRYDEMAAKIDTDKSMGIDRKLETVKELTLDDITNDNLRRTLKATGLFSTWHVYFTGRQNNENRDAIYITKDKLQAGDLIHGERLSDWNLKAEYSPRKVKKYLQQKDATDISDLEPQFYVVVAKKTVEHDKMDAERDARYKASYDKALEKLVKKCLKEHDFGRTRQILGEWNNDPLLFKVVRSGRVDLMQKVLAANSPVEQKKLLLMCIDSDGWPARNHGWEQGQGLLSVAKDPAMLDFLFQFETPVETYAQYEKLKKRLTKQGQAYLATKYPEFAEGSEMGFFNKEQV